ncbi:polyketide antibiotic transporter [uncultured Microbacterium sp.]|uniref:ABC transporter permease n=1 Tax=uncultured Microbacterium sp. TaxID=191216 RepID=UPI0026071060|nr:polyketide antibiotic transporter [uncultured Microbacterium sp.]
MTLALVLQRLRRDRVQVALWVIGTAALAYFAFTGVAESFATEQDRRSLLAAALANPVILLFRGLPSGADEGAFIVFLIMPWLALFAGFMSSFLAVRHTRGDEEPGRTELVAATPAGRVRPAAATVLHGLIANTLLAGLTAAAFLGAGQDAEGSILAGISAASVGVVFLGVGLVAAQLMRTSRGANALTVWILLIALLTAGFGNAIGTPSDDLTRMESSWLTWLSPIGWAENTRALDENLWRPLALSAASAAVLIGVALALVAVRDVGESFIAERHGHAVAPATLSGHIGLVWRLTRSALAGWVFGGFIVGVLSTSLASIIDDVGADNPAIQDLLDQIAGQGSLEQGTVTTFFTMLGILAAAVGVQVVTRARSEEAHGTAEVVLATPLDRVRWLRGFVVVAFAAIIAVVTAAVAGAVVGVTGGDGDPDLLKTVLVVGLGQVAAASVFVALTALVFVLAPRLTLPLGWSIVMAAMVIGVFGPIFSFPEWLTHLSPIAASPQLNGTEVDLRGLWWLVTVAVGGSIAALRLMRRRELAPAG